MPEGPTILILRDQCQQFGGRKVLRVEGNSKVIDAGRMQGRKTEAVRSWGKHFLICFPRFTLRVHFMLFGSYRINKRREAAPRLSLGFSKGEELNFYACSMKYIEEPLDEVYDQGIFAGRQHHQERGAVPHQVASAQLPRRLAPAQAHPTDHPSTTVQLRFPGMAARLRAQETPGGPQQGNLPALPNSISAGLPWQVESSRIFRETHRGRHRSVGCPWRMREAWQPGLTRMPVADKLASWRILEVQ